jgi:hypothetical protein
MEATILHVKSGTPLKGSVCPLLLKEAYLKSKVQIPQVALVQGASA